MLRIRSGESSSDQTWRSLRLASSRYSVFLDSERRVYGSIPVDLVFQAKGLRRQFRLCSLSEVQGDRIKPFV